MNDMIDLESPDWGELRDAFGPATQIPRLLRGLRLNPRPTRCPADEPWCSLWSALYHNRSIDSASYAAVPHIVSIGIDADGAIDRSFFLFPKEIVMAQIGGRGPEVSGQLYAELVDSLSLLSKIKIALSDAPVVQDDGSRSVDTDEGWCKQCGHRYDPHVLLALSGDPKDGGVIFCPEFLCTCFSTWSLSENS